MNKVFLHSFALILCLTLLLPTPTWANGTAALTLVPSSSSVNVGDTVNVDIRVSNATNLYAVEVHLTFDKALLQVLDDDDTQPGIQILPGSLFPSVKPSYVVVNKASQENGTVDFAMTLLAPTEPVTGGGTLATVRFSARARGAAQVGWVSAKLADRDGNVIGHTAAPTTITINECVTPPDGGKTCSDLIENGGFEETRRWDMPVTPHKANYSTADKHSGSRSVRLGIEPGSADVYSHSSAYQKIHVPANATSVTLTFWARRFTQDAVKDNPDPTQDLYDPAQVIDGTFDWNAANKASINDWQEVLILQAGCYNWLATLMRERSNNNGWTQYTYDLTAFAGQDIVVYFNVINNGNGYRTWMFVDDVQVNACYGSSPCAELVRNRGFEWTGDWYRGNTPRPADYTTDAAHGGTRSMRLGVASSTGDAYSHSSAYQHIVIPAGASNPTLSFWYKAHSQDTIKAEWDGKENIGYNPAETIQGESGKPYGEVDWQEMFILDRNYQLLSGGVVMRQVRNDGVWRQVTFDLSPYKGREVVLYFNVINDGNGKRTWMYIDDVSVNVCGQQVRFDPAATQTGVGQTITVYVRAENVGDLYAIDATVRFNPAILEATAVSAGGWWSAANPHIIANTINNTAGEVRFAASLVNPAPALNGSGNLIAITFRGKANGNTPLWFANLQLVNASAAVMPVSRTDGQVTVGSTVTPLTGDVNNDGCVNILDMSAVGGQFGSTNPNPAAADINGDGRVDIVDVVLVARNFGTCR